MTNRTERILMVIGIVGFLGLWALITILLANRIAIVMGGG